MKTTVTFVLIIMLASAVKAQNITAIGGGFCYGSEIDEVGLTFTSEHQLSDVLEFSPSLNIFYVDKYDGYLFELTTSVFTINGDVHYLFPVNDKFTFYPLGGINLGVISIKTKTTNLNGITVSEIKETEAKIGLNLGIGGKYRFNNKWAGFTELKYVVSDFDQMVLSFGVLYSLR